MVEWMELMWLKPSSPRLAMDCLGISETPLAKPPREGTTSTSSTCLQLLSTFPLFPPSPTARAHKADKGDGSLWG